MYHFEVATIAPMMADFLLNNPGVFDHIFPLYSTYTSQVLENPDELEPGFLVGVDLNHGVSAARHMLLLRRADLLLAKAKRSVHRPPLWGGGGDERRKGM
jgi:hypothetical protein